MGSRSPPSTASGSASRICGTTCSGVTQLMLWQPIAWSSSIISASRSGVARSPRTSHEMSWFWQKTQRRLQPEKKIVPEPRQPRRQFSSPKCGKYEATTARRPIAHRPLTSARRSTLQRRGQAVQRGPKSSYPSRARRSSSAPLIMPPSCLLAGAEHGRPGSAVRLPRARSESLVHQRCFDRASPNGQELGVRKLGHHALMPAASSANRTEDLSSAAMAVRILVEGRPGSGKTTIAARLAELLTNRGVELVGFVTREMREGGRRVGFEVETIDGKRATLAHVTFSGPPRVGRYGVDVESFERIALPSLL